MIKAYCINLDERTDRWEQFTSQEIGVPVERFSAISRAGGNQGCLLSHLEVMSKCEDEILIFEDDCKLLQPWEIFEEAYRQLPADWDMLYLGANTTKALNRHSNNLFRLYDAWTTHGILYKRKMIDVILADGYDKIIHYKNYDTYMVRCIQWKYNTYIIYPCFATQFDSYSDVVKHYRQYPEIEINFFKNTTVAQHRTPRFGSKPRRKL